MKYAVVETILGLSGEVGVTLFSKEDNAKKYLDEMYLALTTPKEREECDDDILDETDDSLWCDIDGQGLYFQIVELPGYTEYVVIGHCSDSCSAEIVDGHSSMLSAKAHLKVLCNELDESGCTLDEEGSDETNKYYDDFGDDSYYYCGIISVKEEE